MSRSRTLTGLTFVAVAAAGLVATATSPTLARTDDHGAFDIFNHTASHRAIQGHVVNQFGNLVDDVDVEAVNASGTVVASALTYAPDRGSGPQHGYFRLEVGKAGTYTLTLAREGYENRTIDSVRVARADHRIRLGHVTLAKVLVPTTTTAQLVAGQIARGEQGQVQVSVVASTPDPCATSTTTAPDPGATSTTTAPDPGATSTTTAPDPGATSTTTAPDPCASSSASTTAPDPGATTSTTAPDPGTTTSGAPDPALVPSGRVEIRSHGKVVGVAHLGRDDAGLATIELDKLRVGDHTVKARYRGSRRAAPSTSGPLTLTVTK